MLIPEHAITERRAAEMLALFSQLGFDIELDPRPEYHRCMLDWNDSRMIPIARSTGNQLSSRLMSMHEANALLVLPERSADRRHLKQGEIVDALVIGRIY